MKRVRQPRAVLLSAALVVAGLAGPAAAAGGPSPPSRRWLDDSALLRALALTERQGRALSAALEAGRPEEELRLSELSSEQARFKALVDAEPPDGAALEAGAARLATARRAAGEATARLLVAVRECLTRVQWEELARREQAAGRDPAIPAAPPAPYAPSGTWWRMPEYREALALTDRRVAQLEDAYLAKRPQIAAAKADLDREEAALRPLLSAEPFDAARARAQAARVPAARERLERGVLDARVTIHLLLSPGERHRLRELRGRARPGPTAR